MVMSTPYELVGRTRQKSRTRAALVDAARTLVTRGLTPTVEDAAAAAAISRTTAYRYFPNQHALLVAAHPETEAASLLPLDVGDDPEARLDAVVEAFTQLIADSEPQQRTMLRLSLEPDAARREPGLLRQGRAIGWITEALAPLRGQLPDADLDRLVLAVRSAIGIEARVWLTDVAGLSPADATQLVRWSAKALYQATVRET
ncbi:MAG: TetR family transcriptional regulator [Actinomycetia bacterium]|nr:TetR family transcriptional regulator [Actinomycetes bacterium]